MAWLQLTVSTSPDDSPALEDLLLSLGALSITFRDNADQPILEPALGETPLWQQTAITGLFNADIDSDGIDKIIAPVIEHYVHRHRWEIVEDKDWEREWMQHYQPIHCGENLWICPSWQQPPEPTAVNVILDPGLAFGTGTHPTTLLCLQWLAKQSSTKQSIEGLTVIDYGCGSGILGIAALLLGAKHVIAVDIDPQALLATRENARRNGIDPGVIETYLPEQLSAARAELVFANILAGPLVNLAPRLIELANANASLCLSGILSSQGQTVIAAYTPWCQWQSQAERDQWLQVTLVKSQSAGN